MDPMQLCPGKGLVLSNLNIDDISRYLLISSPNNEMSNKSPFAIQKALIGIGGEPKSVKPPHKVLNYSRGVIFEPDLLCTSEAEILEGFSDQGVTQVRRITIEKDATVIRKKHLILTFNIPNVPTIIKVGYLDCNIHPYVTNPLHCFKCQRFGHSQTSCRGQLTCSRCASVGHSCMRLQTGTEMYQLFTASFIRLKNMSKVQN
ncbi:uncharacterized protein TNCV_1225441 [Trichonephila clavipes]|nr:uncharacterized protein TNCV_1225441 [Trichonephila clavipes]